MLRIGWSACWRTISVRYAVTPSPEKAGDSASKMGGSWAGSPTNRIWACASSAPWRINRINTRSTIEHSSITTSAPSGISIPLTRFKRYRPWSASTSGRNPSALWMVVDFTEPPISSAIARSTAAALLVGAVRRTGRSVA
jgi:hypothetical protein